MAAPPPVCPAILPRATGAGGGRFGDARGAVLKRVIKHPAVQQAGARALGLYLDFALRSTRWTLHGEANVAPHFPGAPALVAFWHERLSLMPMLWVLARRQSRAAELPTQPERAGHPHRRGGRLIGPPCRRAPPNSSGAADQDYQPLRKRRQLGIGQPADQSPDATAAHGREFLDLHPGRFFER